jgi:putative transposase
MEELHVMERLNQTFKDRVECFDDYFPCWKEECDRGHVCAWIKMFSFYYNTTSSGSTQSWASPQRSTTLP